MSDSTVKTPSAGVRALLAILSILLSICLLASLLATALIADARLLTSQDGFKKIVTSLITTPEQQRRLPLTAAMGGARLAEPDTGSDLGDSLVSWLCDSLESQFGEELPITEEQMSTFLEESTVKDFLADKAASYMSDFVNGTNTTITSEELEQLLDENKALIEDTFGVAITPDIQQAIAGFADEMKIGDVIQNEVLGGLGDLTIPGCTPLFPQFQPESNGNTATENGMINSAPDGAYTVRNLMADIRVLTSVPVLIGCIAVCLVLMVALFFTNRMRLPGTLTCVGIPALIAGILLVIPTSLLQALPDLFSSGDLAPVAGAVGAVVDVIAPVHYGLLGLGAVLIVAAIVIKIVSSKKVSA